MGEFFTETNFLGSLGQQQAIDERKKYLKRDSLFFLPIKKTDKINKFLTRKKGALLKEECSGYCGSSAIALLCLRGYFACPKFSLWVFRGLDFPDCNIFSCWLLSDRNQKYINLKASILFQIDFKYC